MYVSGKHTQYYKKQSPTIQVVQEQGTTAADISKAPTALPLKWLADKPGWVKQYLLTIEKLQALEQLVQKQLDAQHIEDQPALGILLYLLLKRNLENVEW